MKNFTRFFSIASVLFLFSAISYAQTVRINDPRYRNINDIKKDRGYQIVQGILQKQYHNLESKKNVAERTTSITAERLKSFAGFNILDTAFEAAGKSDTGKFVYSGQRGSVFDYQMMIYKSGSILFTSPMGYNNGIPGTYFIGLTPLLHLDIMPDSVSGWNFLYPVYGTDTLGYGNKSDYHYSGNNLSIVGNQSSPVTSGPISRTNYYYDGTPRLISILNFSYNTTSSSWDSSNMNMYFYNTSNQIIMDSSSHNYGLGVWGETSKDLFAYDGSGNMIFYKNFVDSSLHWRPNFIRILTYNTDNTLKTDSISDYVSINGTFVPSTIDSYFYSPGISYFTSCSRSDLSMDTIVIRSTANKHVNVSGLPDTVYYRYYLRATGMPLSLALAKKTYFTYDTYKNPTVASAYNYNITDSSTGAGWYNASPDRTFFYHYETYTVNEVKNIIAPAERILIYPNPAADAVTISRPDAVKGSYTFITLININGQIIRTESLPWMNETETVSLSGLAAGMYMLSVKDKDGNTLSTQKIEKH